jgi:hypothetical protein
VEKITAPKRLSLAKLIMEIEARGRYSMYTPMSVARGLSELLGGNMFCTSDFDHNYLIFSTIHMNLEIWGKSLASLLYALNSMSRSSNGSEI